MKVIWTAGSKDTLDYGICEPGREIQASDKQGFELLGRGLVEEITEETEIIIQEDE